MNEYEYEYEYDASVAVKHSVALDPDVFVIGEDPYEDKWCKLELSDIVQGLHATQLLPLTDTHLKQRGKDSVRTSAQWIGSTYGGTTECMMVVCARMSDYWFEMRGSGKTCVRDEWDSVRTQSLIDDIHEPKLYAVQFIAKPNGYTRKGFQKIQNYTGLLWQNPPGMQGRYFIPCVATEFTAALESNPEYWTKL